MKISKNVFISSFLSSQAFYLINKTILKKIGIECSVFLEALRTKINYNTNHDLDDDGWVYWRREDIQNELNITPYQQRKIIKKLTELKIIKTKLKNNPAKIYYKIDDDVLFGLLIDNKQQKDNNVNIDIEQDKSHKKTNEIFKQNPDVKNLNTSLDVKNFNTLDVKNFNTSLYNKNTLNKNTNNIYMCKKNFSEENLSTFVNKDKQENTEIEKDYKICDVGCQDSVPSPANVNSTTKVYIGTVRKVSNTKQLNNNLDYIKDVFIKKGGTEQDAIDFYNYYEMVGWVVGRAGKKMKSVECAISLWLRNKIKFMPTYERIQIEKQKELEQKKNEEINKINKVKQKIEEISKKDTEIIKNQLNQLKKINDFKKNKEQEYKGLLEQERYKIMDRFPNLPLVEVQRIAQKEVENYILINT